MRHDFLLNGGWGLMQRANYLAVIEHNPLPLTAAKSGGEGEAAGGRGCRDWIFMARLLSESSIHSPGLPVEWKENDFSTMPWNETWRLTWSVFLMGSRPA